MNQQQRKLIPMNTPGYSTPSSSTSSSDQYNQFGQNVFTTPGILPPQHHTTPHAQHTPHIQQQLPRYPYQTTMQRYPSLGQPQQQQQPQVSFVIQILQFSR
ncbi:hypothetical protein Glove_153g21 [Diversispora epigaea]|uniref:Uncharacterized protein n=1 Tax=Diversispora epigaea TaxID=1348612 RepID=A0A397IVB4_9GLOM|nr:hypothetical protein Glove_153g21 [Diversispora epigaea]